MKLFWRPGRWMGICKIKIFPSLRMPVSTRTIPIFKSRIVILGFTCSWVHLGLHHKIYFHLPFFNASLTLLHDISIPFRHFSLIPFLAEFRWLQGVEAGACKSLPFAHDDIEDLAKARQLKSYDELISHVSGQKRKGGRIFLVFFFFWKWGVLDEKEWFAGRLHILLESFASQKIAYLSTWFVVGLWVGSWNAEV